MKTKAIILLFAVLVSMPSALNGQGLLRRAIKKQIGNRIDSTLEKGNRNAQAEQGMDRNGDQPDNDDYSTRATGRGLFGGKIDIKYEDEYRFTGRIYMQLETYDKKDVMVSDYYTYFNKSDRNACIEMQIVDQKQSKQAGLSVFIFDGENRCFIMLVGGTDSKTGIISTLPSDSAIVAMAEKNMGEDPEHAIITKTGDTRTIAGYKCEKYMITYPNDDSYANVWMTKDVVLNADRAYWGKAGIPTYYNYPGFEGGLMLAMESFDKNKNPVMKMETKEINEHYDHVVSTVGYTFMKMNFGKAGIK
jgi:hypothetical protein